MIGAKPSRVIRFDKIHGFTRFHDGRSYLVLIGSEKYNAIYNRIRFLSKRGIAYVFSNNFAKYKVDSNDFLPLEKTLTLHNLIIRIKSVFLIKIKITTTVIHS